MKYFRKLLKIREKPGAMLVIAAFFLILVTYIFSKHQDTKIITYQNQSQNFNSGRIISRNNDIYKRKDKIYTDKVEALESKLEAINSKLKEFEEEYAQEDEVKPHENAEENKQDDESLPPLSAPDFKPPVRDFPTTIVQDSPEINTHPQLNRQKRKPISPKKEGPAIISFPVKANKKKEDLGVQIPSGSFVKAKLLTGIEAPEGKALPVLLQADYAFIGPNKSKVDLSGCFLIAKSTGNLSIERVEIGRAHV